jgi:DNA-binding IclR family transcriptional regulator
MTSSQPSTDQAVMDALASQPDATANEIATAAKVSRSTVGKALARLERARKVRRTPGGRDGRRRLPDRWSLVAKPEPTRARSTGGRLRPGELDNLVLDYLHKHSDPLGPTAVARGLGRSSGAVGNCLARLAAAGRVRQVSERPRRYTTS